MPEINLLQPQKRAASGFSAPEIGGSVMVWVILGLVVVELGVWGGLYLWHSSLVNEIQAREAEAVQLEQQIAEKKPQAEKAMSAQSAISSMENLLNQHVYTTQLWKEIGKTALKAARYLGLSVANSQDKFQITGEVPDYTTLGKVLLGLATSGNFTNVKLVSSGAGTGESVAVSFEIEITIQHAVLLKKK